MSVVSMGVVRGPEGLLPSPPSLPSVSLSRIQLGLPSPRCPLGLTLVQLVPGPSSLGWGGSLPLRLG